jgi:hypothetical protein
MKKAFKYLFTVVLPITGFSVILGACASMQNCNNDACYDRQVSSADPYKKGEIAAWGSEKEMAEQENRKEEFGVRENARMRKHER